MDSHGTWTVYDCEIVDPAAREGLPYPRAIRVSRDEVLAEASDLPKGFTTKVLLNLDFSKDDELLSFVRAYGIVMCPYGGAMDRTFAAIEQPVTYRRLLHSVVEGRKRGEQGPLVRLFGHIREAYGELFWKGGGPIDPSEDFVGCDSTWDAKRIMYDGMLASRESDYLSAAYKGFVRDFEHDDMLVGTERLRALAWNHTARARAESGVWDFPECLISLEEVRTTLYLLQVSAAVFQGLSYIDDTLDERRRTGSLRRTYMESAMPASVDSSDDMGRIRRMASRAADDQRYVRRYERFFSLFLRGRPNLLKAFREVRPSCLTESSGVEGQWWMPDGILGTEEELRVQRIVESARERCGDDPETLELLDLSPAWAAMDGLRSDLAIFLEACLTDGWTSSGHHLIETRALRVDDVEDGGPFFGGDPDSARMTLQKAIARQIVQHLDLAYEGLHGKSGKGGDGPVWRLCSWCGEPFMFRNTSTKLVLAGEEKPRRDKPTSSDTCSDACRMAKKRSEAET